MKRLIIVMGCIVFLSACSMDVLRTQIPFLEKSEEDEVKQGKDATENREDLENTSATESESSETSEDKLLLEAAFFNDIVQVDGKNIIQNPTNVLVLVNQEFALPNDYKADDLVRPNVNFSFSITDEVMDKSLLRKEAADALEKMFADAKLNGMNLFAVSGYRSYERQEDIFTARVSQVGYEQAAAVSALPGNSEHQTGLAMDISSQSAQFDLTEQFGETLEGKWLMENAHRFGFILRYPQGKEDITGYNYEPWHYRYVGVKAATEIHEKDLTLEEYFNIVEKI